eukprot:2652878-Pyramimonas_sp.AAC.1
MMMKMTCSIHPSTRGKQDLAVPQHLVSEVMVGYTKIFPPQGIISLSRLAGAHHAGGSRAADLLRHAGFASPEAQGLGCLFICFQVHGLRTVCRGRRAIAGREPRSNTGWRTAGTAIWPKSKTELSSLECVRAV